MFNLNAPVGLTDLIIRQYKKSLQTITIIYLKMSSIYKYKVLCKDTKILNETWLHPLSLYFERICVDVVFTTLTKACHVDTFVLLSVFPTSIDT